MKRISQWAFALASCAFVTGAVPAFAGEYLEFLTFRTVTTLVAPPVGATAGNACIDPHSGKPVCRVEITMSFNGDTCTATITNDVHTNKNHKVVEWFITNANQGFGGTAVDQNAPQFAFAKFPSIPAVQLYDDSNFTRWKWVREDKFIWRIADKGSANYFVLVKGKKTPSSAEGFCEIHDPIITNDDSDY